MNFKDFSTFNRRRCESPIGFNHPLSGWSLSDWMTAAMGELGEAANIAKKLNRVRDGIPGNDKTPEELKAALADEIADTFIYLDLLAQSQGIVLQDAVIDKFERTSKKIGYDCKLFRRSTAPHPIDQLGNLAKEMWSDAEMEVTELTAERDALRAQVKTLREALSGLMLTSEKADICLPVLIDILKAGRLNWEIAQEHLDGLRAAMPSARAALAATEE